MPKYGPRIIPIIGAMIAAKVMALLCKPIIGKAGQKQKFAYKAVKHTVKATSLAVNFLPFRILYIPSMWCSFQLRTLLNNIIVYFSCSVWLTSVYLKNTIMAEQKAQEEECLTELNMPNPIITLTTDFGLKDPYVAEMKAVILSISPNTAIVDITHQIEKFNIRMGAYVLAAASPYFPKGTIHVVVVDPGVGTQRKAILIQTKQGYFIGPDNGVLTLAAKNQGIEHVYKITNPKLMLPKISNTFHGRDIFAPAAAHLAKGTPPSEFGPEIHKIVTPKFAKITKRKNMLTGEVIHIDGFGNIITNFREKQLESMGTKATVNLKLKDIRLKLNLCKAYAEVEAQKPLAIIGSHNFLEISINQGNAAETFKTKVGDKVTLYRS